MRQIRYIIRAIMLLWIILNLAYLNRKTTDNIELIAEFKFETFDKMMDNVKNDSLYTERRLDILNNETNRFTGQILEDTLHFREGILYLIGAFGLFIFVELGFLMAARKKREATNIK